LKFIRDKRLRLCPRGLGNPRGDLRRGSLALLQFLPPVYTGTVN